MWNKKIPPDQKLYISNQDPKELVREFQQKLMDEIYEKEAIIVQEAGLMECLIGDLRKTFTLNYETKNIKRSNGTLYRIDFKVNFGGIFVNYQIDHNMIWRDAPNFSGLNCEGTPPIGAKNIINIREELCEMIAYINFYYQKLNKGEL